MSDDAGASAAARPTAAEPAEPDWTDQVADLVVDTVDRIRDRTTGPILDVAKGSVYALVALILLPMVGVLFLVGLVRLLNWAVPGDVWFVYGGLGLIFSLVGFVLWSKRSPSSR